MNIYLWNKFKGQYRVLPELDQVTKDIPRLSSGQPDPDYDDFYISCKYGKIKHGVRDNLVLYVPSKKKFTNIIRKLGALELHIQNDLNIYPDNNTIMQKLLQARIVSEIESLDEEGYFVFKADKLTEWADILKPSIKAPNTHPLSFKNFTNKQLQLPVVLKEEYQQVINSMAKQSSNMEQAQLIKEINKQFLKQQGLPSRGELRKKYQTSSFLIILYLEGCWNEYIEFLKTNLPQ